MEKQRTKLGYRAFALVLTIVMVLGMLPGATVTAEVENGIQLTVQCGGTPISGAEVTYTIEGAASEQEPVTTGDNGVAVIELTDYVDHINAGGSVKITYSVTADGYENVSGREIEVTELGGNYNVEMTATAGDETDPSEETKPEPKTVTLTIKKTGSGSGTITIKKADDEEVKVTDTVPVNVEVEKGKDVTIVVAPDSENGSYTKSVTIGDEEQTVAENGTYSHSFTDDTTITVEFVQRYTLTVSADKNSGSVMVKYGEKDEFSYTDAVPVDKEGDEDTVIKLTVAAYTGYKITSIEGADADTTSIINNGKSATAEVTMDGNKTVTVNFEQIVYTVTVTYTGDGTVKIEDNEVSSGGTVEIVEGDDKFKLTAEPKTGYRVASVSKNGEVMKDEDFTIEDGVYSATFEKTNNYEFVIKFALKEYIITATATPEKGGTVTVNPRTVKHGEDVTVTVTPEEGYYVKSVKIGEKSIYELAKDKNSGIQITKTSDNGKVEFGICNIQENKIITAEFSAQEKLEDDVTKYFNSDGALRTDTEKLLYIFGNDATVTFKSEAGNGKIKITTQESGLIEPNSGENTVTIDETKSITRVELGQVMSYTILGIEVKWTNWTAVWAAPEGKQLRIVFDKTNPEAKVTLNPEEGNTDEEGNRYFSEDFTVSVTASDIDEKNPNDDYSGIATIEYWIAVDGEKESETTEWTSLYKYNDSEEIQSKVEQEIKIKADDYNQKSIIVYVKVTDRAGNTTTITNEQGQVEYPHTDVLNVNSTPPTLVSVVDVEDGTSKNDGALDSYYTARTIQVKIQDWNKTFDKDAATDSILIQATGRDENGETIDLVLDIGEEDDSDVQISWADGVNDDSIHVATITFNADAHYTLSIGEYVNYVNKAGKEMVKESDYKETGEYLYQFTVDKTVPTGKIQYAETPWGRILETLTFGIWSNQKMDVTVTDEKDNLTENPTVTYYKWTGTEGAPIDAEDLEGKVFENGPISVSTNEAFVVYAKIVDEAGNVAYISTNGLIYDNKYQGEQNDLITITAISDPNENGYYTEDIGVKIEVQEYSEENEIYSGIKSVSYKIEKPDENGQPEETGRTLYAFDANPERGPTYGDLKASWSTNELDGEQKYITISAEDNSSEKVTLTVTVVDNAGNEYFATKEFAICTDKPTASVFFDTDDAAKVTGEGAEARGYFRAEKRVATLTVIDREDVFDEDKATAGIIITAEDANGKTAVDADDNEVKCDIEWDSVGNTHTATITFPAGANYDWSFNYTNKAGLSLSEDEDTGEKVKAGESVTPFCFTVDKIAPTGKIWYEGNIWYELLEELTFGIWSSKTMTVKAEVVEEKTSPVYDITYYKDETNSTKALTVEDLNEIPVGQEGGFTTKEVEVEDDEQFVVYARLVDYAGNVRYISTNGLIFDDTPCNIDLTQPNENHLYGSKDVREDGTIGVTVEVTDPAPYSGIATIKYWIAANGEEVTEATEWKPLYTYNPESEKPEERTVRPSWEGEISVNAEENNSSDVVVYVKVVDNAGNEHTEPTALDIDITAPTIEVRYDNDIARNGKYFNGDRTATIVITERTGHFVEPTVYINEDVPEGVTNYIHITAVDAEGKPVESFAPEITWTPSADADNVANTVYTATIPYDVDANYTFDISNTDLAGNVSSGCTSSSVAYDAFTVDKIASDGSVTATSEEGSTKTWGNNHLIKDLTFGFWSGRKITVTGKSSDATSPIESIQYYKVSNPEALSEDELKNVKDTDWTGLVTVPNEQFTVYVAVPNEQFTVYLKITDYAGNVRYISTDGMIVDDTAPREESIAPEITVTPEQPINGLYNGDVEVTVEVSDPTAGDTFSGLKLVGYRVRNMDDETQSDILYSFDSDSDKPALRQTWTGTIEVKSELNNSNDVVIEVYAEDNAGNTSSDRVSIQIDITPPSIDISYDDKGPDSGSYYNADRVATITVTERNFNGNDVKVSITNTDGTIPKISDWTEHAGTGNGDNTTYTATIRYAADGDYTFDIDYTDLAGNACPGETYAAGTTNPTKFTIDKTAPVVSVAYDNNDVANETYFKAPRTATVTIVEHNFDVSRVSIAMNADRGGVVPNVFWTNSGNTHTARITYDADGDYTFQITMKDMAGNTNASVNYGASAAATRFTIDTTFEDMIRCSGVANGAAYGSKVSVIPKIEITDINLDAYEVTLTGVQKDNVMDLTSKANALLKKGEGTATGILDIFDMVQDMDGIYTLSISALDKAGNADTEVITFTVNRFGSVYVYNDYLMGLISNGGAYVQSVADDLVITEYNADKLLAGSLNVEITCDGKPLENVRYDVTPEINNAVAVGESGWYQYRYTISKDNFASDGVYKISVSSEDATGNTPENSNYEELGITFYVDNTLAEITSIVGLEKAIINATQADVKYTVFDTMGIQSIKIYINGELVDEVTDFGSDRTNYTGSFTLSEQSSAQSVRVVVEDLSGNLTDTDAEDFSSAYVLHKSVTVSTNIFVRWYANKPLFWGSLAGVVVVAVVLWIFLIGRKKKKKEEDKAAVQ